MKDFYPLHVQCSYCLNEKKTKEGNNTVKRGESLPRGTRWKSAAFATGSVWSTQLERGNWQLQTEQRIGYYSELLKTKQWAGSKQPCWQTMYKQATEQLLSLPRGSTDSRGSPNTAKGRRLQSSVGMQPKEADWVQMQSNKEFPCGREGVQEVWSSTGEQRNGNLCGQCWWIQQQLQIMGGVSPKFWVICNLLFYSSQTS